MVDPVRQGYIRSGTDGTPYGIGVVKLSRAPDCNEPPLPNTTFSLMRSKPWFSAVPQLQENRKCTTKEPYWPQLKRKPSTTFRKTNTAFCQQKILVELQRTVALNFTSAKVVQAIQSSTNRAAILPITCSVTRRELEAEKNRQKYLGGFSGFPSTLSLMRCSALLRKVLTTRGWYSGCSEQYFSMSACQPPVDHQLSFCWSQLRRTNSQPQTLTFIVFPKFSVFLSSFVTTFKSFRICTISLCSIYTVQRKRQGRTGSSNRPWLRRQTGPISSGVTKAPAQIYPSTVLSL